MRKIHSYSLLVLSGVVALACSGATTYIPVDGQAADGGATADAGGAPGNDDAPAPPSDDASPGADGGGGGNDGGSAGTDGGATCTANLASDPKNCGACGHSCLGGACAAGACQAVVLVPNVDDIQGIALGGANVFYTSAGAPPTWSGSVTKVGKTGGAQVVLTKNQSDPNVAVADATNVYWVEGSAVMAMPSAGTTPLKLTGLSGPYGIAVDAANVYISTQGGAQSGVYRTPIGHTTATPTQIGQSYNSVFAVTLDAQNIYWGQIKATAPNGAIIQGGIYKTSKAAPGTPVLVPGSATAGGVTALVVSGGYFYYLDAAPGMLSGALKRLPLAGGSAAVLASNVAATCVGNGCMATDGTMIYIVAEGTVDYYTKDDGAILAVPMSPDGSVKTLAAKQLRPLALAVDSTAVYWVNAGTYVGSSTTYDYHFRGEVMKIAK